MTLRPDVQLAAVLAVAKAVYETEAGARVAGVYAAALWLTSEQGMAPMTQRQTAPTVFEVENELMQAGMADPPDDLPATPHRLYARGVYACLRYALGWTDELPQRITNATAWRLVKPDAA